MIHGRNKSDNEEHSESHSKSPEEREGGNKEQRGKEERRKPFLHSSRSFGRREREKRPPPPPLPPSFYLFPLNLFRSLPSFSIQREILLDMFVFEGRERLILCSKGPLVSLNGLWL